jgi:ATP phosphoribosyltransferase regulatory subunit
MTMSDKAAIRAEAARLQAAFEALGAEVVETDILQPAETLFDLYGEDIRGRAYVTSDPVRGEAMLRPDFTVPVVQSHMARDRGDARYTYSGEVFRKQEDLTARASEFAQVGYEVFGGADPAKADAEIFAAFSRILAPLRLRAATGDIGLLTAAVQGLSTTDRRKAALMRHIWRPRKFRALLDRYGGRVPVPDHRLELIAAKHPTSDAPEIGLRSVDEVRDRITVLRADAEAPHIAPDEIALLEELLDVREAASAALLHLKSLSERFPALETAVNRFAARLDALAAAGIDIGSLEFEASYGRTSMEYYDGFVFGFYAQGREDLPPVATGGRYDALTRVLGNGRSTPAVGGVVRPALMIELEGSG